MTQIITTYFKLIIAAEAILKAFADVGFAWTNPFAGFMPIAKQTSKVIEARLPEAGFFIDIRAYWVTYSSQMRSSRS